MGSVRSNAKEKGKATRQKPLREAEDSIVNAKLMQPLCVQVRERKITFIPLLQQLAQMELFDQAVSVKQRQVEAILDVLEGTPGTKCSCATRRACLLIDEPMQAIAAPCKSVSTNFKKLEWPF
eukprot:2633576-Pleurochrysis_carterae.AAC.4